MQCPSCLCSEALEVTIGAQVYLECTYCGNLSLPSSAVGRVVRMNCPSCRDRGITIIHGVIGTAPKIKCSACNALLIHEG
jgi:hypothetical protein